MITTSTHNMLEDRKKNEGKKSGREREGSFNKAPGDKRKMTMLRHLFETVSLMVCVFFKILFQNNRFEINLYVLGNLIRLRKKNSSLSSTAVRRMEEKEIQCSLILTNWYLQAQRLFGWRKRCHFSLFYSIFCSYSDIFNNTKWTHAHNHLQENVNDRSSLNFYQSNPFHLQWKFI